MTHQTSPQPLSPRSEGESGAKPTAASLLACQGQPAPIGVVRRVNWKLPLPYPGWVLA